MGEARTIYVKQFPGGFNLKFKGGQSAGVAFVREVSGRTIIDIWWGKDDRTISFLDDEDLFTTIAWAVSSKYPGSLIQKTERWPK